jgi:hypothetical protein
VVELFQQKATMLPQAQCNSRPKEIPCWLETYVEAILVLYPTMYIREVQQLVSDDLGLTPQDTPSCSWIRKLLRKSHITRKKCTFVAIERFTPYIQLQRQNFFQWRQTVDPRQVYFFDESSFSSETDQRKYGYNESGFALPEYQTKRQTSSNSVLSAIGYREGVLMAIPVQGNFNIELVNDVIQNQILPLLPNNCYLVADNASVHNEASLAAILYKKNITLVMLPAYSYDLNPIEMVFGLAKALAQKTPGAMQENMLLAVVNAFVQMTVLSVRNFYGHTHSAFKICSVDFKYLK